MRASSGRGAHEKADSGASGLVDAVLDRLAEVGLEHDVEEIDARRVADQIADPVAREARSDLHEHGALGGDSELGVEGTERDTECSNDLPHISEDLRAQRGGDIGVHDVTAFDEEGLRRQILLGDAEERRAPRGHEPLDAVLTLYSGPST
jgi:hypothetical protein